MAPIADAREALVGGLTAEEPDVAVADCQPPPPSRYWPVRVQVQHIPARQSVIDMRVERPATARCRWQTPSAVDATATGIRPRHPGAIVESRGVDLASPPAVNALARA